MTKGTASRDRLSSESNDRGHHGSSSVVNVASVPQLSPFRYPGGKTWLVPWIRHWLKSLTPRPRILVEPFAGGGTVSLTAVFEELVEHAILVELDGDVASLWQAILRSRSACRLIEMVGNFDCTVPNVDYVLNSTPSTVEERAFRTLVMNRTRYGGIIAPRSAHVRRGENGR